jgi:hypothetical protein
VRWSVTRPARAEVTDKKELARVLFCIYCFLALKLA